jgi:hypothetical protein
VARDVEPVRRLAPAASFYCERLHATAPIWTCFLRQAQNRTAGRTADSWRGQAALHPSCYRCPQGAELLAAVPGGELVTYRGAGPGGRFEKGRPLAGEQAAARKRLQLVGLLESVRTIDAPMGERAGPAGSILEPLDQVPE